MSMMFRIDYGNNIKSFEDWKSDNYMWKWNGRGSMTIGDHTFKKLYQVAQTVSKEKEFEKHVYVSSKNPSDMVVHYIGDEQKGIQKLKTPKSVLNKIDLLVETITPAQVYRNLISGNENADKIRNEQQIISRRNLHLRKQKLSHDELYNVYDMGFELPNFVHSYSLLPNYLTEIMKTLCPEIDDGRCVIVTDNEKSFKNAFMFHFPNLRQYRYWNHLDKNIERWFTKRRKKKPDNDGLNMNDDQIGEQVNDDEEEYELYENNFDEMDDTNELFQTTTNHSNAQQQQQQLGIYNTDNYNSNRSKETRREKARRYIQQIKLLLSSNSYDEYEQLLIETENQWEKQFKKYFHQWIKPDIHQLGLWQVDGLDLEWFS
ncbi:unnamed protein product [Didymodactylos carnosus]|uniref:MULE transposase domain-containing protein n=1 Tax=Didymodactylos carnosus TaxID=1234261 RepID=A0A814N260_9BILA|nr:unnamed protein product [Didymodactylos carnosus]CAF1085699.1 unnamed protein product [Didymodactylos carnosus]CAF3716430.1 unnamed protein product [Didymodactylos carnosus]CAF3851262.1 unnamed protein product [Didymodactylos carnosus]